MCWKNCNVGAIEPLELTEGEEEKNVAAVAADKCLGCGACISTCPTESLSLVPVSRPEPPARKRELFVEILKEKKRYTPFVVEHIKKTVSRKIGLG